MTPIVLLHPLGSDNSFWDPVVTLLPEREIFAIDLLGHGRAAGLRAGAGLAEMANAVLLELESRGLDHVEVVGVSLGGLVAAELAASVPDRVDSLVLADTVVSYPDAMRTMWSNRAALVRGHGVAAVMDATLAAWFTPAWLEHADRPHAAIAPLIGMDPEMYARSCELLRDVDIGTRLVEITACTLIVCGEGDSQAFHTAVAEFRTGISRSTTKWIPGRHAAVYESANIFAPVLEEFLHCHRSLSDRKG